MPPARNRLAVARRVSDGRLSLARPLSSQTSTSPDKKPHIYDHREPRLRTDSILAGPALGGRSDAFGRRRNITLTPAPLQAHHENMSSMTAIQP